MKTKISKSKGSKTRKAAPKLKRKGTPKLKGKTKAAMGLPKKRLRAKAPKARQSKKTMATGPVAVAGASSGKSGAGATQYDKQVFTRFETPALKELVRTAAEASGISLSGYIAHFAVEAAQAGKKVPKPEAQPEEVAAAG